MASKKAEPSDLASRRCVPCEGGVPPLPQAEVETLMPKVPGWSIRGGHLVRRVEFEDFLTLMDFVNDIAQIAEEQGHHPDFCVHYSKLDLELWTHAIDGLSDNDFIMAARIDALLGDR